MDNKQIGFNLVAIRTEQFALIEENFNENEEVNLGSDFEFKLSCKNNQLGVYASFKFEQKGKVFLKIQVSCHFSIRPESWQNFCNNQEIVFPKGFMAHISMLTVGTTRGVLYSKTDGTIFSKFMLPLINVVDLINEDVKFSLPE
jgi:hypothetical protein